MSSKPHLEFKIEFELSEKQIELCARMMEQSEPWITLGRGYEAGRTLLQDKNREKHLATVNDEIVGFAILLTQGALTGYLQTLCIAPNYRGQGVGQKLMNFAESKIFSRYPNFFLMVSDFNTNARKFYEHLGYQIIGELCDYLIPNHSEILMRKTRGPIRGYLK